MHKALLSACVSLAATLSLGGAVCSSHAITLWDFQDHYWDETWQDWVVVEQYDPEIGQGTWELQGGVTWDPYQEDYRDPTNPEELNSSSDPIHLINEFMGLALDTDDYPLQGTGNRTAGVRFNVSTEGHQDIIVKFDLRVKRQAARHSRFQYTVDGSTWIDGPLFIAENPNAADHWYYHTVDLTSKPGVNNNPKFAFRVVAEFGPSGKYEAAYVFQDYRPRHGYRFDMVQVLGNPLAQKSYILSNKAASEPVVTLASPSRLFTVFGKVRSLTPNTFLLDDGSGSPVLVLSGGYSGIAEGQMAKATGKIDNQVSPVTLTPSGAGSVSKLAD